MVWIWNGDQEHEVRCEPQGWKLQVEWWWLKLQEWIWETRDNRILERWGSNLDSKVRGERWKAKKIEKKQLWGWGKRRSNLGHQVKRKLNSQVANGVYVFSSVPESYLADGVWPQACRPALHSLSISVLFCKRGMTVWAYAIAVRKSIS